MEGAAAAAASYRGQRTAPARPPPHCPREPHAPSHYTHAKIINTNRHNIIPTYFTLYGFMPNQNMQALIDQLLEDNTRCNCAILTKQCRYAYSELLIYLSNVPIIDVDSRLVNELWWRLGEWCGARGGGGSTNVRGPPGPKDASFTHGTNSPVKYAVWSVLPTLLELWR